MSSRSSKSLVTSPRNTSKTQTPGPLLQALFVMRALTITEND
jgi:hypothetical protein